VPFSAGNAHEILRSLKSLQKINGQNPADLWKAETRAARAWSLAQAPAALPAKEQLQEVTAKLVN